MWHNARFLNLIANALIVLALTVFSLVVLHWWVHRPVFTLERMVIEPLSGERIERASRAGLRTALAEPLSGNFFTVNLAEVRDRFESVPWVRQVQVRRDWPNSLRILIDEYQPLGLWNDNQVLDLHGQVFTANQAEADGPDGRLLPVFAGPEGAGPLVQQRYQELLSWLAPLGHQPVRLTLSARYAWLVELDNGLVLDLGREPDTDWNIGDPDRPEQQGLPIGVRVQRFVANLPQLEQRLGVPVVYADLRYPDGFAVRLAQPSADAKPQTRNNRP